MKKVPHEGEPRFWVSNFKFSRLQWLIYRISIIFYLLFRRYIFNGVYNKNARIQWIIYRESYKCTENTRHQLCIEEKIHWITGKIVVWLRKYNFHIVKHRVRWTVIKSVMWRRFQRIINVSCQWIINERKLQWIGIGKFTRVPLNFIVDSVSMNRILNLR